MVLASAVVGAALAWWGYTYAGYPLILALLARRRPSGRPRAEPNAWPHISICIVAHNASATIAETIERTLALDYPADRRQILVVSDGSTDDTDAIVRRYFAHGVELLRVYMRSGKTVCENHAIARLRGEIIVNTDVSVVVHPSALKPLVRAFDDPDVGVASGRDISVAPQAAIGRAERTQSESVYVGYEMWVRDLETRVAGLVGASGCLYAALAAVQRTRLPGGVARDFASALIARDFGLRAVSVRDAVCYVPRSTDISGEFRRKRRTITRGLATLARFRRHLDPRRAGVFSWMLVSHKLMRWLAPWWALAGGVAVAAWSTQSAAAAAGFAAIAALGVAGAVGTFARGGLVSRICAPAAFAITGNLAVVAAWVALIRGINPPVWEPTRRTVDPSLRSG